MTEPLSFDLITYSQPSCGRHPDDAQQDVMVTVEAAKSVLKRNEGDTLDGVKVVEVCNDGTYRVKLKG